MKERLQPMPANHAAEAMAFDLQSERGSGLVAAIRAQRRCNCLPLGVGERCDCFVEGGDEFVGAAGEFGGKILDSEHRVLGQGRGAFQHVSQFTDIAGPIVFHQSFHRGRRELVKGFFVEPGHVAKKLFGQKGDILLAISERGDLEGYHVEPEIQVDSKRVLPDHFRQGAVRGGDDPDVDGYGAKRSERDDSAFLQASEQAGLRFGQKFADLIEKERAAIGGSENPTVLQAAPVNAPRTWPKSCDSRRESRRVEQSTGTNGPDARGPAR